MHPQQKLKYTLLPCELYEKEKHFEIDCMRENAFAHKVCGFGLSQIYFCLFFETNQAGELPIILKRRNNTQTGHHNNQQDTTTGQTIIQLLSNSTQTTTGWIGTSTRLHNSTGLHTPLLKSEWDINPRSDWVVDQSLCIMLGRIGSSTRAAPTQRQQKGYQGNY